MCIVSSVQTCEDIHKPCENMREQLLKIPRSCTVTIKFTPVEFVYIVNYSF